MRAFIVFIFSLCASLAAAETHTWWFETTWVMANPDGFKERPVIGFNNSWPLPTLRVKKGDTVNVYLTNGFDDRNTTLHFHGMFQNGSSQMDGPEMVTQCPIAPGDTMLYNFSVPNQEGTFWYHSHTAGQYGDGMRGLFIIESEDGEYPFDFDEEVELVVGDWYHETADVLLPKFMSRFNPTGAEPLVPNTLFNNTLTGTWKVEPNTTYFLRIANVGGFLSQYLFIEDHEFTIVEVDGVYVNPQTTDMLYITIAQRYGVLVTTKSSTDKNYAFMNLMDDTMLDSPPDSTLFNNTNYMVYDETKDMPEQYTVDATWDAHFDDFQLTTNTSLLPEADQVITVDVAMNNLGNGVNYAFFNNVTFTTPKVPTLFTALSAGEFATNAYVYGNTNAQVLNHNEVVDIVLNNYDTGTHPFHLHGHTFQLIARGTGDFSDTADETDAMPFNATTDANYPEYPMMRDVIYVEPLSYVVLRFRADNPGVWFFHCHIEWHLVQGLALVLIEAPEQLQEQETQQLTENHKEICKNVGVSTEGNAAGNTVSYMDLTGANVQQKALPSGFTARGIVALVFSCIAGILGIAAIAFYGMAEIKDIDERVMRELADLDAEREAEVEAEIEVDNMVDSSSASSHKQH